MLIFVLKVIFSAVEDFTYADINNSIIVECISQDSSVEIPKLVVEVLPFAFASSPTKEVRFQEGSAIEKIDSLSFQSQTLESISFPPSLSSLSKSVFSGSSSLKSVIFQSAVENIPDSLFAFCSQLQNLSINGKDILSNSVANFTDSSVISVGFNSFYQVSISKIIIPPSFTKLQARLFKNYQTLNELIVDYNISSIPDEFLSNCSSLDSISIADKVNLDGGNLTLNNLENVGVNSFFHSSIKSILISRSVIKFSSRAFVGCSNLLSITIEKNYSDLSIVQFDGLINLKEVSIGGYQIILNQILNLTGSPFTIIPDFTFSNSSLVEAIIPGSVESIGKHAFSFCKNLKKLFIESELKEIPEGLLYFSNSVENISIGNQQILKEENLNLTNFEFIGSNGFYGISTIKKVILSKNNHFFNVRAIGGTSVESIHFASIPDSFSTSYGFYRSPDLNCITLSDSCENYSHLNFQDIFAETPLNLSRWCDSLCAEPSISESLSSESLDSVSSPAYPSNPTEVPTYESSSQIESISNPSESTPSASIPSESAPPESISSESTTSASIPSESTTSASISSESTPPESISSENTPSASSTSDLTTGDIALDIILLCCLLVALIIVVFAIIKCLKSRSKDHDSVSQRSEMNSTLI